MQRLIAWLLKRYTPFRVLAWGPNGKIAGIGYSNIAANLAAHGMVAESGVAQMRAKQFEAAMAEAEMPRGEMRNPKPWPLDRRAEKREPGLPGPCNPGLR